MHDELVQEFYGLDSETMLVACASITKSGRMHRWTEAGGYLSAQLSGPSVQAEVTRHFGLIYLVAVQPDATVELRQQVMRGLRATARLLRNYEMPWTRPFDVQSPTRRHCSPRPAGRRQYIAGLSKADRSPAAEAMVVFRSKP